MDHKLMKERVLALYDGELTGDVRREAENHLAGCAECRRSYEQWRSMAKGLFREPQVQPPELFVDRVMERIDALERPRHAVPWTIRFRWAVPAMALASLLFLILGPTQRPVSIETLLLADAQEGGATQLVLASRQPTADEADRSIMEAQL